MWNRSHATLLQACVAGGNGINGSLCCFLLDWMHVSHRETISAILLVMPGLKRHSRSLVLHRSIPMWPSWTRAFISILIDDGTTIRFPLRRIPCVSVISSRNVRYGFATSGMRLLLGGGPCWMKHLKCYRVWSFAVSVLNPSSFVPETGRLCSVECTWMFLAPSAISGSCSFLR